jgi:hypothetical protein
MTAMFLSGQMCVCVCVSMLSVCHMCAGLYGCQRKALFPWGWSYRCCEPAYVGAGDQHLCVALEFSKETEPFGSMSSDSPDGGEDRGLLPSPRS